MVRGITVYHILTGMTALALSNTRYQYEKIILRLQRDNPITDIIIGKAVSTNSVLQLCGYKTGSLL